LECVYILSYSEGKQSKLQGRRVEIVNQVSKFYND